MGSSDVFCARCGARQNVTGPAASSTGSDYLGSFTPRTASILCYIPLIGWIASVIVLASERFRHDKVVRFHAFQGLCIFIVWLIVDWVAAPFMRGFPGHAFGPMRTVSGLLHLSVIAAWIWMFVKTSQGQVFRLPILGELADRLVAEQR